MKVRAIDWTDYMLALLIATVLILFISIGIQIETNTDRLDRIYEVYGEILEPTCEPCPADGLTWEELEESDIHDSMSCCVSLNEGGKLVVTTCPWVKECEDD